jgi:anti-anti-sigma regulatory factor
MTFGYEHSSVRVIAAEEELTIHNAERFRAKIELAAAASQRVIVDLTNTTLDSWAMLMLIDLYGRLGQRLTFVGADHCRELFKGLSPPSIYVSLDEAVRAGETRVK